MLHSKITRGKRNSRFMIYADFESILVTEYYDDLYLIYDVLLLTDQKIMSKSLFEGTSFNLRCNAQYDKI